MCVQKEIRRVPVRPAQAMSASWRFDETATISRPGGAAPRNAPPSLSASSSAVRIRSCRGKAGIQLVGRPVHRGAPSVARGPVQTFLSTITPRSPLMARTTLRRSSSLRSSGAGPPGLPSSGRPDSRCREERSFGRSTVLGRVTGADAADAGALAGAGGVGAIVVIAHMPSDAPLRAHLRSIHNSDDS